MKTLLSMDSVVMDSISHVALPCQGTAHEAVVDVTPRFSSGWRGFYFVYFYFFAYRSVGPSLHAGEG